MLQMQIVPALFAQGNQNLIDRDPRILNVAGGVLKNWIRLERTSMRIMCC